MSPPAICWAIDAELAQDLAGEAADAELQALEIVERLDLLAEPAAHLRAGAARQVKPTTS